MTNPETAAQPPAHWTEELRAAFWTAVNAPTYDESAAATLHLVGQLAGIVAEGEATQWPGPLADLIAPTRPAAVSVPPPAPRADDLSDTERQFLTFALDLAFDRMVSDDGFTDEDEAALAKLRRLAAVSGPCVAGEQQNETPEAEVLTTAEQTDP